MSEVLERFRAALRPEHALLEQTPPFRELLQPSLNIGDYASFLVLMQRFYAALEPHLSSALALHGPAWGYRYTSRLPALLADLQTLSLPVAPPARLAWPLTEREDVLGVLFVVEGSRHGARLLRRSLGESLAGSGVSFAFLDLLADEREAGEVWGKLLGGLEKPLSQEASFSRLVAVAAAVFVSLRRLAQD